MRLLELKKPNVIVVYGGGFQPFHEGHMSSYRQAKTAFPNANFFVAASNVTTERPFQFSEKQFLAQQAGVKDPVVQVGTMSYVNDAGRKVTSTPLNPLEVLQNFNPERDVLVIVRSERDPMKTTATSYYQPWQGIDSAEPFSKHAYIFVTKKHDFTIAGNPVYSGSQVRELYTNADEVTKIDILNDLYPSATNLKRIKQIFDRRLAVTESLDEASIFADTGDAFENGRQDAVNFRPKNDAKYTLRHKYRSRYSDGYKYGISQRDRSINPETGKPYIAFGPASKGEYDPVIANYQSSYIYPSYNAAKKDADKYGKKVVRGGVSKWKIVDKNDPTPEIFENLDPETESKNLLEFLRKIHKRWAIVSKREGRPLVYFKGEGKPSPEWVERQERRIKKFKKKKR
jgi:hypothetical protein